MSTALETAPCSRCNGTGLTVFEHVEHRGKAGGCFACNGTGIVQPRHRRDQVASDAKNTAQRAIEAGRAWYAKQGLPKSGEAG